MRNFKLKDGYVLGQDIKGDGIVNLVVKKIDGSEDDAIVGKVIDGKYVIDADDKVAKLVYESDSIYASESSVPGEDFDIIADSEISNYIEVIGADEDNSDEDDSDKDDSDVTEDSASDESEDTESEESSVEEVVEE